VKITYIEDIYDPAADFRRSKMSLVMYLQQTSSRYIHAVMNNLKFIILDYLAAKKYGILV